MSDRREQQIQSGQHPDRVGRRPLNREAVIMAALDFVQEHGLPGLTMRRLGNQLGVEAMSLYHHVNGREDLLEGMVDHLVGQARVDPNSRLGPSDGWQAYLQALARSVRTISVQYPHAFPLVATRHPAAPWLRPPLRSLEVVEDFLTALTSRGFTDDQAVRTYKLFTSFLLGHLLLEVATQGAATGPVEEPLDEGEAAQPNQDAEVDETDYPLIQRMRRLLSESRAEQEFDEALEALLDRLDLELGQ